MTLINETRATIHNIQQAQRLLEDHSAVYQGNYAFTDTVFSRISDFDLNKEFFRIRHYQKTQWKQQLFAVAHKVKKNACLNYS